MDLPQQQQHPEINLDENRGARVMLMEKTLLNPIFLVALMMYSLLIGNSLSGRTATPHGYGAPPPSPAGLATFMGVSFMCLSFVTVGMVHLVLVLHLTMVRGVGGFPRLTILFRWFMPACLLASTFVYFVQSMHTTRYGIWRSEWITFCIAGVIFVVINLSMMLRPLRQVGLTAFE
ncbi:uncharacterized protein [Oryza sativa Japonica Group]|jgi:hypothetical protein|uniref:Os07g0594400 protein n=1 Tax=Oryza sativa subsp. japonica TaxID=39947 RepID=A0A0P0X8D2_ORYSJ|nr:uncharacterized protein LOC9268029 isoform X1 [Oryza sativa Japonica Group]KAF2923723.1 hypothetical protein DAI22_07g214900 [Oryza sativa Japonica Group]BAT02463.1 Os07g0594400 [Oryza sativa Japonica Group]